MLAITKVGFLGNGKVNLIMDILVFQTTMLEGSNIGGVMKSMDVNYTCASKQMCKCKCRLANKDLTPRLLNLSIRSVGSDTN